MNDLSNSPPPLDEFILWTSGQVQPYAANKTIVFAPGGTSRWYFLEHAHSNPGYHSVDAFLDYGHRALARILELAAFMFNDGVQTLFIVGFVPGQDQRDPEYNRNLSWAYEVLISDYAVELYGQYEMKVLFRGGWSNLFDRFGATNLLERFTQFELTHKPDASSARRLIWLTTDTDLIPQPVLPFAIDYMQQNGKLPDRNSLASKYYGTDITHIDILIGNNKPSVAGLTPPLTTLGDTYFTVSPSLYMDHQQWRTILYDHLFARGSHYRDYRTLPASAFKHMRSYYDSHRQFTIGVGHYHEPSQTWRPNLAPAKTTRVHRQRIRKQKDRESPEPLK
jgi:hypothetical protein